jgi:hypothetical protein
MKCGKPNHKPSSLLAEKTEIVCINTSRIGSALLVFPYGDASKHVKTTPGEHQNDFFPWIFISQK